MRQLAADAADREEMRRIREQLAALAPRPSTDPWSEVLRLPGARSARCREQRGARYAIAVQADELPGLSALRLLLAL